MTPAIKLAPSILSADFGRLRQELDMLAKGGVDYVHMDIMDGHFVNNITFGMPMVSDLRQHSNLTFDAHLMISNPLKYVDNFIEAGADIITFHHGTCENPAVLAQHIRAAGRRSSMALRPHEPIDNILPHLNNLDMVLVMSVDPGFGGQPLQPIALEKAKALRDHCNSQNIPMDIQMDGGINLSNIRTVLDHGVNVIVIGSAIFDAPDPLAAIKKFRDIFDK